MKKVLLISFFHTSRPGGSFRPVPLVKYLPECGWESVVLTPELTEKINTRSRIIETPYRDALGFWKTLFRLRPDKSVRGQVESKMGAASGTSKLDAVLTWIEGLVGYPDLFRGWKRFAVIAGEKLLQKEKVDAMISCAPITSHIIAAKLKDKYKLPWVADFPDLWSQNHGYAYFKLRHWFDTRLEKNTLKRADALITISEPWAEKLRRLHPDKDVHMIPHGYDPELFDAPAPRLTTKFTITYTGVIYHKWQDITRLFSAVKELIGEKEINPEDLEIRFYGNQDGLLESKINEFNLDGLARQYGKVPQKEAAEKQRESQLLLLLGWNDPGEKGVYTSKVFEYLGARRPILVCGGDKDVVTELMDQTKAGTYAFTVSEIKESLKKSYAEFKESGRVKYAGLEAEINGYSHREMARKFAEVLDGIV